MYILCVYLTGSFFFVTLENLGYFFFLNIFSFVCKLFIFKIYLVDIFYNFFYPALYWGVITKKSVDFPKVSGFGYTLNDGSFLMKYVYYCVDVSSKYHFKSIYTDRFFWFKPFLYSLLQLSNHSFYVIDGIQFKSNSSKLVVQFNSSTMLTSNHLSVFTILPSNFFNLISISSLFKSSTWLERELSEFTGIFFLGLLDTRRLLLDYFESKQLWQTHIGNDRSYNSNLYDITLNF